MKSNGITNVNSSNNPANIFANIICSTLPSNNNDSTDSDHLNDSSMTNTANTESNVDEESSLYININNNNNHFFNSGMCIIIFFFSCMQNCLVVFFCLLVLL